MPTVPFEAVGFWEPRPFRLRRSYLAVPGSSAKMMAKAATVGADAVFFDLEDAVPPEEKPRARRLVAEALAENDYGDALLAVRVNDVTTPWCHEDITAVLRDAGARLDCLVIPKVAGAGQMWFVEHLLNQLEAGLRVPAETGHAAAPMRRLGLDVLLETATGSVNLGEICRVTDRTQALVFGPGDYAPDLGVPQRVLGMIEPDYPGHQWHYVMARIANHARAVDADAIDGPYADFRDPDGFVESCTRARLLGFDGKVCIHPSQVELANAQFAPTAEQVAHAHEVLHAYEEARKDGRGTASLGGAMIDDASRRMAERLVARGTAAGVTCRRESRDL